TLTHKQTYALEINDGTRAARFETGMNPTVSTMPKDGSGKAEPVTDPAALNAEFKHLSETASTKLVQKSAPAVEGAPLATPSEPGKDTGAKERDTVRSEPARLRESVSVARNPDGSFGKGIEVPGNYKPGINPELDKRLLAQTEGGLKDRQTELEAIKEPNKTQVLELERIKGSRALLADPSTRTEASGRLLDRLAAGEGGRITAGRVVIVGMCVSAALAVFIGFQSNAQASEVEKPIEVTGHEKGDH
ncbi:MAG: hypothetical protein ACRD3W_01290, partial [Terriglobales bacterium]